MFVERKGLYVTVTHFMTEKDEVEKILQKLGERHPWSYHQGEPSPTGTCYFHRITYSTKPDGEAAEKWLRENSN